MPPPYPALPGRRMAWDRHSVGFFFRDGDVSTGILTEGQRQNLNNEQDALALTQDGSGPTDIYIGVIFPVLTDILGIYLAVSANNVVEIETSLDTTDGLDGVWTSRETGAPVAGADITLSPSDEYRTEIATKSFLGVKAIRFRHEGGSANVDWYALHLYGDRSTAGEALQLWHPVTDARISPMSFEDAPRRSSADLLFRVKNQGSLVSSAVTLSVEDLVTYAGLPEPANTYLVSVDGLTFGPTATIGTLAPSQISQLCYLRRVTPIDATLGLWQTRVVASGTNKADAVEYVELGDVSTNVPTPHIWYLYQSSVHIGDEVHIVGHGFGDNEAEYVGEAVFGGVTQTVDSWTRAAASGDAYGALRKIQAVNDTVNVEHGRIVFTVPPASVDNPVLVRTDA